MLPGSPATNGRENTSVPSSPGSTTSVAESAILERPLGLPAADASADVTRFLWLLKLGGLANIFFLANTPSPFAPGVDPYIVVPAQVFFVVSAFRCFFPVRY